MLRGMRGKAIRRGLLTLVAGLAMATGLCGAQAEEKAKPPTSIWEQETLTGDWGGARSKLKETTGIDINLIYIGESLAVLSGGTNRRASYEGRFQLDVDTDLGTLIGWKGASTHFTVFNIHNGGFNAVDNVGSIADPSNIDALATTRLFTAWFQYGDPEKDRVSLRLGQLAGDDEFITSQTASGLISGTFGWAGILAANMTSGGPAYPLATPGIRVKVNPTEQFAVQAAVFSGDPAGRDCNDNPQICNRYGTTFSFSGGALWMGELQFKRGGDLPGIYKLGAWYATTDFADQRYGFDVFGNVVSLADPALDRPLNHRGNWGIYAVADQKVAPIGKEGGVNVFIRSGISPSDRNLLNFYVDGGVGFTGFAPNRPKDVLTFGVAYAHISPDAAGLDQDTLFFNGPPYPIRDYELVFELSYQWVIAPWWIVQPDLQFIVHPGGNVPNPNDPTATVRNAFVAGIRTAIKF
jgi:porin